MRTTAGLRRAEPPHQQQAEARWAHQVTSQKRQRRERGGHPIAPEGSPGAVEAESKTGAGGPAGAELEAATSRPTIPARQGRK